MAKVATTKNAIKKNTIRDMKQLGTYKEEYDQIIDVYSDICEQYFKAVKDFKDGGEQYEVPTGTGSMKKSAIVSTMEQLRKDIITYSDRLCLNPKSNQNTIVEAPNKSSLADVLSKFG